MTHYSDERQKHNEQEYPQPSDWPKPDRIENIFFNGGEALHYPEANHQILTVLSEGE